MASKHAGWSNVVQKPSIHLCADKTCTCVVCVCEMPFMDDTHVIRAFGDKDP